MSYPVNHLPSPAPSFAELSGKWHACQNVPAEVEETGQQRLVSSQSLLLREQQARVQRKIILGYRKFSIWKWQEKRSASHRLSGPRVLGEILSGTHMVLKYSYEKSRIQFTPLVFAVRLYIWKQLDCHQNLSSAQMLESPTTGLAVMQRQKLKLIYSSSDNCNQLASCQ